MSMSDRALGMDRDITRRDFLNGASLVIGAAMLPGYVSSDVPTAQAMTLGSLGSGTVAYLLRNNRTARQPAPTAVLTSAPACPTIQDRDLRQYDCFIRR